MRKHIDESQIPAIQIKLKKEDVSYFNFSSNQILSFVYNGELRYFRECPLRLKWREYFERTVECFFDTLGQTYVDKNNFKQEIPIVTNYSKDIVATFESYLKKRVLSYVFLKKLSCADKISQKLSFSIWKNQVYNEAFFDAFGLEDLPSDCEEIAVYFLWYMRGASTAYRTRNVCFGRNYSFFSASKSIASKIVADILGLGHIITTAEFCYLNFENGTQKFGVMSNIALGCRMIDVAVTANWTLQKELLNLNILDIICFQTDHGTNNYNVNKTLNKFSVCAFDNDNPNTFLPIPSIKCNFMGCSSLVDKRGVINRPCVSRELLNHMQQLDFKGLRKNLKPYLNLLQVEAIVYRTKKIKKMLALTESVSPERLLLDEQWDNHTVELELNGTYGKTYLTMTIKEGSNV